jgi:hypothetical protein
VEITMNAISLDDQRLQLTRILDGLAGPDTGTRHPAWHWRRPERFQPDPSPAAPSSFTREWVAAGQRRAPAMPQAAGRSARELLAALREWSLGS